MATDIFSLLTFPVTSDAFSAYSPGQAATTNSFDSPAETSATSPRRKATRLEGDTDHSDSVGRRKDKGKGKQKATESASGGVLKLRLVNPVQIEDAQSEKYVDSLLPKIHDSICAVLDDPPAGSQPKAMPLSYEAVYQATRSVVLMSGKGQWIFDKLDFELRQCVNGFERRLLTLKTPNAVEWLQQLVVGTQWFDARVNTLVTLLTYVERVYFFRKPDARSIRQLASAILSARIFESLLIVERLTAGIREWIEWERLQRVPHAQRETIMALLRILHSYGFFDTLFLQAFLNLTKNFYEAESARLASPSEYQDNPQAFLEHCDIRLVEERTRAEELFQPYVWCWPRIEGVTEKALLESRLPWLSKGIAGAIGKQNVDGLSRMYILFSRVDGLKLLCDAFKAHVHTTVFDIVNDRARDDDMVDRLLAFKAFIDVAMPLAFSMQAPAPPQDAAASELTIPVDKQPSAGFKTEPDSAMLAHPGTLDSGASRVTNKEFAYAAADAFQTGFRARRNKPAELIARHIDRAMRKGQREESDESFGKRLDAALALYRYTEDKDVFRTFYHRALARRLLLQRSASDDFEKTVLKRLEKLDPEFSMGEKMFKDLDLSRDFMRQFHEKQAGAETVQYMTVMVLQRSEWPFSPRDKDDILLPPAMQEDLSRFTKFYVNSHVNRVLNFDHSLGMMQLRARFASGEKELSVSLFQGVILLLFNDEDELGFLEIKNVTRMDDSDLRRTLQSLACSNKKVLKKRPVGREVNDTDFFLFNIDFADPRPKVHINSIQAKETPEENRRTQVAIDGDRKHHLDAAIVRIMKARKSITHQKLIPATIDAVKGHFVPDIKTIKERIEQLIEQEYMKRDEDEDNMYLYVA